MMLSTAGAAESLALLKGSCLTDNAVLQRGKKVPIWGEGTPAAAVTVKYQAGEWTTTVTRDGRWRVDIGPFKPHAKDVKEGDVLTCVVGEHTTELKNVLVGDVWLCLGQSNMDRPLGAAEDYPARVDGDTRDYPNVRINGIPCSRETFANKKSFSALPYHFGRHLFVQGDVPIGILQVSLSGNPLQSFLSPENWQRFLSETGANMENEWQKGMGGPSAGYRGLHRLAPMAVSGVFWDQGEGNTQRFPARYAELLDYLYAQLCEDFEHEKIPFLLIHKGIFGRELEITANGLHAAVILDAFNWAGRRGIAVGLGMARWVAADPAHRVCIGNHDHRDQVHYWGKEFAARRAAEAALGLICGKDLPIRAPTFKNAVVEGQTMRVSFSHSQTGLSPADWVVDEPIGEDFAGEWAKYDEHELGKNGIVVKKVNRSSDRVGFKYADWRMLIRKLDPDAELGGFCIAGADAVLYPARATIDGSTVVASNPEQVPKPQYVAYGVDATYMNWNLYGKNGLPVIPFWSGPWPPGKIPGNARIKVFRTEPNSGALGNQVTLRWEVEGVPRVKITPDIGEVAPKGKRVLYPSGKTVYQLDPMLRWPNVELDSGAKSAMVNGNPVPVYSFKRWKTEVQPAKPARRVPEPDMLDMEIDL